MERRVDLVLVCVGEDGQEIISGLLEVFFLSKFRKGNGSREPLDGNTIACSLCGRHEDFVAAIVFQRGANIESFDSMWRKG